MYLQTINDPNLDIISSFHMHCFWEATLVRVITVPFDLATRHTHLLPSSVEAVVKKRSLQKRHSIS